ncbi:MAG: oxidoreductase [Proteobacteria bacterium]|nr:oxidoreductase [Pseudomonadota bacterium]
MKPPIRNALLVMAGACSSAGFASAAGAIPCTAVPVAVPSPPLQVQTVASGLANPWGLVFLPNGRMLVTERAGRLRLIDANGQISPPISGVPAVHGSGQGGLLDIALAPDFADSRLVYLSYSEPGPGRTSGTAVLRAVLDVDKLALSNSAVIFRQKPKVTGDGHYGSRLVFARDGALFVTVGERQQFSPAQDLGQHHGKVVRILPSGAVPPDNPFVKTPGAQPEIWSLGHRNPQGAALNPASGELWISEHGAMGGDEINIAQAGRNYGWPIISYGRHYGGGKIGEGTEKPGLEQPRCYWDPSIAPGNIAFYTGNRVAQWRGNLFVTALKDQSLVRLTLDGARISGYEKLLPDLDKRLRDVRQGPDGWLYLLTDSSRGEVLRVQLR